MSSLNLAKALKERRAAHTLTSFSWAVIALAHCSWWLSSFYSKLNSNLLLEITPFSSPCFTWRVCTCDLLFTLQNWACCQKNNGAFTSHASEQLQPGPWTQRQGRLTESRQLRPQNSPQWTWTTTLDWLIPPHTHMTWCLKKIHIWIIIYKNIFGLSALREKHQEPVIRLSFVEFGLQLLSFWRFFLCSARRTFEWSQLFQP